MALIRIKLVEPERIIDLRWRVLRPTRPREAARFAVDPEPDAFHLAALVGERPVGCVTFFPEPYDGEPGWRLRGMAVEESFRDRGIGGQLIERGTAEVADRGGALVWCNGRTSAARFYERHGFERRGEEFTVVPSGPHYVFIRRLPAPIKRLLVE